MLLLYGPNRRYIRAHLLACAVTELNVTTQAISQTTINNSRKCVDMRRAAKRALRLPLFHATWCRQTDGQTDMQPDVIDHHHFHIGIALTHSTRIERRRAGQCHGADSW